MNSQQLQCFIYVAERLNFTKAAEALYLSVPTVTHHIKSLEEEVGVPLFYRSSRVVKLTDQGERFYYDAKDIFIRMQDVRNQFQNHTEQETMLFRIGCMTEQEFKILEPVFVQMRERYPYVRPKVVVQDFFDLKNLYENQQLELAIATLGLSRQGAYRRLTTYQSCAVIPWNHPLAGEKEITFGQIAEDCRSFSCQSFTMRQQYRLRIPGIWSMDFIAGRRRSISGISWTNIGRCILEKMVLWVIQFHDRSGHIQNIIAVMIFRPPVKHIMKRACKGNQGIAVTPERPFFQNIFGQHC